MQTTKPTAASPEYIGREEPRYRFCTGVVEIWRGGEDEDANGYVIEMRSDPAACRRSRGSGFFRGFGPLA
jgi:hypothetical protein